MNETTKSILRHILTLLGGALVGKGWLDQSLAEALIGIVLALIGGLYGAYNEYRAGSVKHAIYSALRHIASAVGAFCIVKGYVTDATVTLVISIIAALGSAIWGIDDEAEAEAAK